MEINVDGRNLSSAKLFFDEPGELLEMIKGYIDVYFCTDGRIAVDAGDSYHMITFTLMDAAKWIVEDEYLTEEGSHHVVAQKLEDCAKEIRRIGDATEKRRLANLGAQ